MTTPLQRQEGRDIRARAMRARKEWRMHRKICRLCAQLSASRSQYCDDGWAIRVELHHAERALGDYHRAMPVNQGSLF